MNIPTFYSFFNEYSSMLLHTVERFTNLNIPNAKFFQNPPKKFFKNIDIRPKLCYYHYIKKKLNHGRGAMRHQYPFRSRFPITVET